MRIGSAFALGLLVSASAAHAATFAKIADETSHPLAFVELGTPAVDAGVVAFHGIAGFGAVTGIYTGSGGALTTVVDSDTSPDLSSFRRATISQGNVAFLADEDGDPTVWASIDGSLTRIASSDTPIPGGSGNMTINDNRTPMIDGRNVAFSAFRNDVGYNALFTSVDGALEESAGAVALPGGATAGVSGPFGLDGTSVASGGSDGVHTGIYVAEANVGRIVADDTTQMPGQSVNFAGFLPDLSFADGNVAFEGGNGIDPTNIFGVYAEIGGVLFRIVDTEMALPGGAGTFQDAGAIAIDGESVAFVALGTNHYGLYVHRNGVLELVAESGDVLDG